MRHRVYGRHLGRDKNQRTALFRGLIRSLILSENITTTQAKAKAIKGLFDRLVTKAKQSDNSSKRVLQSFLVQEDIINKLTTQIIPRLTDRSSGFTRTVRLGTRAGDGAMMVKMSIVSGGKSREGLDKNDQSSEVTDQKSEVKTKPKRKKKEVS